VPLFILLAFSMSAEQRVMMDSGGTTRPLRPWDLWSSLADFTLFGLGLPLAWLATVWAQYWARWWPARATTRSGHVADAVAFLLPILPDISYTFVYRELLSLLRQFGRTRKIVIVALEEGDHHPLHAEARELLAHAVFVPSCSLTRYLGLYVYYALASPRRMARLLDWYRPPAGPDRWMFLRLQNLHAHHPSRGIALTRLLEKEEVGYIHCYGASYPATRALVAATLLEVPFSLSTYVDFDYEYPFKCLAEKLEAAAFVVACTEFCRVRLASVGGERLRPKIHVIHHGIGATGTYGHIDGTSPPADLPVSVFTACRLVAKKGLEYLLHACALLRDRGVSVRCVIIGEGPERRRLEALVAELGLGEEVRLLGALANDEIWRRVGPHDICVVPSVYAVDGERDGIPVILLEALATGHPVISTRVSGIPELITDDVHGLLVPERDPQALAAAIERLIGDSAQRRALATAGQARVRKDFDIHDKARQLWRLICPDGQEATEAPGMRPDSSTVEERHLVPSVSVIIVNHNGVKFLPPLFESVARQSLAPSEVWFFDNASTDGSVATARALLPGIKVVTYGRNIGYSVPVNEGIRRSSADYVLVLNVDVVLEDRFIEQMVTAVERYETAGWAAGRMLKLTEAGKSHRVDCLGHHMARKRYATGTDYSRPFDWRDYEHERFVFGASACAALYRRSLLEDVRLEGEYFDEAFFAYFEDVDLDWRAQLRGWKCLYVPSAVGYHVRGGSGLIAQPEIAACYLSNRWLMVVKNDRVRDLATDLIPVVRGLVRDVCVYGRAQPRAVMLAVQRVLRLLPKALAKRRVIQRRRVVPRAYVRSLIR
jgi:GT2 family glycosyltransferase/glycosyltransferase involved in cell wall biosynthesis